MNAHSWLTRRAWAMLCVTIRHRVPPRERGHQLLDGQRRLGVERRARLVHEDDLGLEREEPRDAELLLLLELERRGANVKPVLQVVPERHFRERLLDRLVQHGLRQPAEWTVHPEAEHHILIDGNRQRVRTLEHHPDRLTEFDERDVRRVDVLAEDPDLALRRDRSVALVDPVEAPQQRGLAAAGRPDQSGHLAVPDVQRHVLQGLKGPVPEAHVPRPDAVVGRRLAHPKIPLT